VKYRIF